MLERLKRLKTIEAKTLDGQRVLLQAISIAEDAGAALEPAATAWGSFEVSSLHDRQRLPPRTSRPRPTAGWWPSCGPTITIRTLDSGADKTVAPWRPDGPHRPTRRWPYEPFGSAWPSRTSSSRNCAPS